MNILILSAGTRNKIIQYFKKELNGEGKVIATDCSNLTPAIYDACVFHYSASDLLDLSVGISSAGETSESCPEHQGRESGFRSKAGIR